jgi:isopenicillin N synthase-like dioxygenase
MNETKPAPSPVRTPSEIETLVKSVEDYAGKGRTFTHKLLSGLCQDFRRGVRQNDPAMQSAAVKSLDTEWPKAKAADKPANPATT